MLPLNIPWKKTAIFGVISALSLFIIFNTVVNIKSFSTIISQIDMKYFWLALATIPPTILLVASRWYFVLRSADINIPFKKIFLTTTGSLAFVVIPGKLGDFSRCYPLRKEVPIEKTVGTIVLERIIDVCILLAYSGIGLFLLGNYSGSAIISALAISGIPVVMLFDKLKIGRMFNNKLFKKIDEAAEILEKVANRKRFLVAAIFSSALNMGLSILEFYWLMLAVHAFVPMSAVMAYFTFGIFAGLIPLTLAGMGIRDATMIYLFKAYALPGQSLLATLLYALQGYWIIAIICLPFLYFFFKEEEKVVGSQ